MTAIQSWWRAILLMREERERYVSMRASVGTISSWWEMVQERRLFLRYRQHVRTVQEVWRAKLTGRKVREDFLEKRRAVVCQREGSCFMILHLLASGLPAQDCHLFQLQHLEKHLPSFVAQSKCRRADSKIGQKIDNNFNMIYHVEITTI